jgi:nucleoside-diphosphate-sugar epimerase
MKILLCGATGFVGRALAHALAQAGHQVLPGVSRSRGLPGEVPMDFTREHAVADWLPRLQGVDAVVNAVGVLRDTPRRPIAAIHTDAPVALFDACAQAGVRRVVQISALGVQEGDTDYASTKRAADTHLLALHAQGQIQATVVRPSVIFGAGGDSTALFMTLARLPLRVLPRPVIEARIQPVAVGELAEAVGHLVDQPDAATLLAAVGPEPVGMADFVCSLRMQAGHGAGWQIPLPGWLTRLSARAGDWVPVSPWCSTTLAMLAQDNVAGPAAFAAVLGRSATPYHGLLATWRKER